MVDENCPKAAAKFSSQQLAAEFFDQCNSRRTGPDLPSSPPPVLMNRNLSTAPHWEEGAFGDDNAGGENAIGLGEAALSPLGNALDTIADTAEADFANVGESPENRVAFDNVAAISTCIARHSPVNEDFRLR